MFDFLCKSEDLKSNFLKSNIIKSATLAFNTVQFNTNKKEVECNPSADIAG